jgi:hypothetical protein
VTGTFDSAVTARACIRQQGSALCKPRRQYTAERDSGFHLTFGMTLNGIAWSPCQSWLREAKGGLGWVSHRLSKIRSFGCAQPRRKTNGRDEGALARQTPSRLPGNIPAPIHAIHPLSLTPRQGQLTGRARSRRRDVHMQPELLQNVVIKVPARCDTRQPCFNALASIYTRLCPHGAAHVA